MFVVLQSEPDYVVKMQGWREEHGYSVHWVLCANCIFLSREFAEKWLDDNREYLLKNSRAVTFEIKELT